MSGCPWRVDRGIIEIRSRSVKCITESRRRPGQPRSARDQFDPVGEAVVDVATPDAGNVSRLVNRDSLAAKTGDESVVVSTTQRWMGLLCGTKILLYAQVDLHAAAFKPATAALGKFCGLGNFPHAQHARIKLASGIFLAGRHGELNVINRYKRRGGFLHSFHHAMVAPPSAANQFDRLTVFHVHRGNIVPV